jgi:hypothetical protein
LVRVALHFFPELSYGGSLLPCPAEQGARELLHLVNEKSDHHEGNEVHAEVLIAEPVVLLQALVSRGSRLLVAACSLHASS